MDSKGGHSWNPFFYGCVRYKEKGIAVYKVLTQTMDIFLCGISNICVIKLKCICWIAKRCLAVVWEWQYGCM